MSTPPSLHTNAGLLLFSIPSSLLPNRCSHPWVLAFSEPEAFVSVSALQRRAPLVGASLVLSRCAATYHTSCRALHLQEEARYLGGLGSKKWILAMDGGERSAAAAAGQKRPFPPDGELVELLWQDGAVVAHSQAQRGFDAGGASGVTEEAPPPAWLPGGGGGGMGGDVYSQLLQSIAQADGRVAKSGNSGAGSSRTAGGEVGSSFCGSNLVAAALHLDDDIDDGAALAPPPPMDEPGPSTSSGWNSNALLLKRSRDDLDSRSEDADFDTVDETPPSSRRPASKRRTRAAEVHNMSERRRRDRINEKMRALQELVPHCNKTDKASILDEAIEYLKSLQMQVQIMWMSTGMAPMMLPGAHQLMPPMTMGLNSACIPPAAQFLSQMQRVSPFMSSPLPNQIPQITSAATNATNQILSNGVAQPRNPFLHPNDALTSTSQVPSLFGYGPQMAQENVIEELLTGTAAPALGAEAPSSSDGTGT